ncbi:MBL fold metallo-hydrolase [Streptomyces sp. NPDC002825]|uniref:MBL fold metallo-hydrolase n=1 Tax=Streptomyces sp. NPDC002825 TaxID=3154666 RepID=UPI00332D2D93
MTAEPQARLARLEEVADGVHAYIQPDGGWCLNNAGLLLDSGDAALVDTAATESRTRLLRDAVLGAGGGTAPRTLVNTHFHGDHTFGNYLFPEAVVIGHERTRSEMQETGLHLTGLWPDVCWGDVELALPQLTFDRSLTLHVGGLRAELLHLGPAHTSNDVVVWVPERGVLFTGDVVMAGVTPFCPMGSVAGSLDVLERLRALGAHTVVPGHGPVSGPEVLDFTMGYLRRLQRLAREGVAAGVSPLDVARSTDLGPYAELLDSERLVPNLHRAYAEEKGAAPGAAMDIGPLFAEMIEFHGGLPVCHA